MTVKDNNKKIIIKCNLSSSIYLLYNKTRHSYILLSIAGQTAGRNGLSFYVDTLGWSGCVKLKKIEFFFFIFKFHFPWTMPSPSASFQ